MLFFVVALALQSPELPKECEGPPTREVSTLSAFVQSSGALSVGLDSVATWCFDARGTFTGGAGGSSAAPSPECSKAISTCKTARGAMTAELRALLADTLADLERPFLGVRYTPRRSGLSEKPSEAVDCESTDRSTLFAQAQARMDLARLAGQAQSEYANYKTWLYAEGLKCAQALARGEKVALQRGVSVDAPKLGGGTQVLPHQPGAPSTNAAPISNAAPVTSAAPISNAAPVTSAAAVPLGGPTAERERALSGTMLQKWSYFLAEQAKIETDMDWVGGFLASRELRECRCQRVVPGEVVRRLENDDRLAQLTQDDEKNTRCELCLLDVFPRWKSRAVKQCALALELSEFELGVLQRSDDGNGLPPRCLEAAKAKLTRFPATAGASSGSAYIIARQADPVAPAPTTVPVAPSGQPTREPGRVYVRIFTSASCAAELLPGPIQARTGDLMPVPPGAKEITVRGACGGFAEVYYGTEEKPRAAETFARDQPLKLQFKAP